MISKSTALKFLNKNVSILSNNRFFKGLVIKVSDVDLILKFNNRSQAYSFNIIDMIQEQEVGK